MEVLWFLPTHGDGRYLGTSIGGRAVRFGIRLHVIVRETEREAWEAADQLIKHLDDETIRSAQKSLANYDSEGQKRMLQLHSGNRSDLEISPNLWAGIGLVRGGAGTALVGDPETVAARIEEYAELGIESFILSGYPHLEEAYRVAELLFPRLDLANQAKPPITPSGEVIGHFSFPVQPASQSVAAGGVGNAWNRHSIGKHLRFVAYQRRVGLRRESVERSRAAG